MRKSHHDSIPSPRKADVLSTGMPSCTNDTSSHTRVPTKRDVRQQVAFVDHAGLTGTECFRVFTRFVVSFRHTQHHHAKLLAQIVRCRADEVADVLHKEEFQAGLINRSKPVPDERQLQMGAPPVVNCLTGISGASRWASRSVAISPTSTARGCAPCQYRADACSNEVFPAPGEEMRFTHRMPRSDNVCRQASAACRRSLKRSR